MAPVVHWSVVTHDPLDDDHPFLLTSGEDGKTQQWLTRSAVRSLRLSIERAEQEDAERRTCGGNRHYPGECIDVLPDLSRVFRCRHCPAEFVLGDDGCVDPVETTP